MMTSVWGFALLGFASLAFGAINHPLTQNNTSGLTQNNTSGLTQSMTTGTGTNTNTGIYGSLLKPVKPLPSISSNPASRPAGLPAGALSTRQPMPQQQATRPAPAQAQENTAPQTSGPSSP